MQAYIWQAGTSWYIRIKTPSGAWVTIWEAYVSKESATSNANAYGYEVIEHD